MVMERGRLMWVVENFKVAWLLVSVTCRLGSAASASCCLWKVDGVIL